jgi:phytoene dehydrogenase-like protein
MTFSAFDDTIAPPGKHNVTVWGQWHPYALSNGEHWDDIREREGTKLGRGRRPGAPGLRGTVEHMHVQTPLDLERELGLRNGRSCTSRWRSTRCSCGGRCPSWRLPLAGVDGLYLCGRSTHPGAACSGRAGARRRAPPSPTGRPPPSRDS